MVSALHAGGIKDELRILRDPGKSFHDDIFTWLMERGLNYFFLREEGTGVPPGLQRQPIAENKRISAFFLSLSRNLDVFWTFSENHIHFILKLSDTIPLEH